MFKNEQILYIKDFILFGLTAKPSIPFLNSTFGTTFLKIFKDPLTSAFIKLPLLVLNKPLLTLSPKYLSCFLTSSKSIEEHLIV